MKVSLGKTLGSVSRLLLAALVAVATTSSAYALTGTLVVHGPGSSAAPTFFCNNPTSNGGWLLTDTPSLAGFQTFITGPGTPPMGTGSVNQTIGGAGGAAQALLFTSFGGAPLSLLATLISPTLTGYDHFPGSVSGGEGVFILFVSYDGGVTISDQLRMVPALNGCFAPGMWATCNFFGLNYTNANPGHDPNGGSPFTLAQYIAFPANSAAVVPLSTSSNPTLGVVTSGAPGTVGNLDKFILNSAGPALSGPFTTLQWDFELDCANYGGDTDGDCYCDTLNPLIANRDKCADLSNATCTGVGTPDSCCTGTGTGTCNDQTDTDGDGVGDVCDNCDTVGNGSCTGLGTPNACCTGTGTGTCASQTDADDDGIGDVCDNAVCPATPDTCLAAEKNSLKIKTNADTSKLKFQWNFKKALLTSAQADFGDPVSGVPLYSLCVYDETAGTPNLVMEGAISAGGICGSKPCWASTSRDKGWSYKNKTGNGDGITKLRYNSGEAGKGSLKIDGKGANLPLPAPIDAGDPGTYFDQDTEVTIQLHSSSTGNCWGSTFSTSKKNEASQFSAKNP